MWLSSIAGMLDWLMSEDDAAPKTNPAAAPKDVVFVQGPTEDGKALSIVRVAEDKVSVGELREMKEGQPIHGEVVKLSRRPEHERLYDVEVLHAAHGARPTELSGRKDADRDTQPAEANSLAITRKGPSKVASDAYRSGWDLVFGQRASKDQKN